MTFRAAQEQVEERIRAFAAFRQEVERVQTETFARLDREGAVPISMSSRASLSTRP